MTRLRCSACGKTTSTEVPQGTIIRAWIECPECVAKAPGQSGALIRYRREMKESIQAIRKHYKDTEDEVYAADRLDNAEAIMTEMLCDFLAALKEMEDTEVPEDE